MVDGVCVDRFLYTLTFYQIFLLLNESSTFRIAILWYERRARCEWNEKQQRRVSLSFVLCTQNKFDITNIKFIFRKTL